MSHTCHAIGCTVAVPPRLLMCARHWKMVPRETQITVSNEYRPGQEKDKQPSLAYLAIQRVAVGQVAEMEGNHDEARQSFQKANRTIERMLAAGQSFREGRGRLVPPLTREEIERSVAAGERVMLGRSTE